MKLTNLATPMSCISLFILSTLAACSSSDSKFGGISSSQSSPLSKDSKFEDKLSSYLNDSRDSDIKERNNKMFNNLYGFNKARNQGIEYCKSLSSGVSKDEAMQTRIGRNMNLLSENKITSEEASSISWIDTAIELAAKEIYCPEHRDIGQIPIKERLE